MTLVTEESALCPVCGQQHAERDLQTRTNEQELHCRNKDCGFWAWTEIEEDSVGRLFWVETTKFPMDQDGTVRRGSLENKKERISNDDPLDGWDDLIGPAMEEIREHFPEASDAAVRQLAEKAVAAYANDNIRAECWNHAIGSVCACGGCGCPPDECECEGKSGDTTYE